MRADFACLLACLTCGALGCANERAPSAGRRNEMIDAETSSALLGLAFNPMYSAYDGDAHSFRVPVHVTGAEGELEVHTSPPDFVAVEPSDEGVILTTRRAGVATVTITDGAGRRGRAQLVVTENRPDHVELGKQRYSSHVVPDDTANDFGGVRDGGVQFHPPEPCVACHSPIDLPPAHALRIDDEYTPQQLAGLSDDELMRIFTEGEKPEGARFRLASDNGRVSDEMARDIFHRFHTFNISPETSRGLVAYLRQLEPKSRGELDFGGLYRARSE